jgi:hypothetical protein
MPISSTRRHLMAPTACLPLHVLRRTCTALTFTPPSTFICLKHPTSYLCILGEGLPPQKHTKGLDPGITVSSADNSAWPTPAITADSQFSICYICMTASPNSSLQQPSRTHNTHFQAPKRAQVRPQATPLKVLLYSTTPGSFAGTRADHNITYTATGRNICAESFRHRKRCLKTLFALHLHLAASHSPVKRAHTAPAAHSLCSYCSSCLTYSLGLPTEVTLFHSEPAPSLPSKIRLMCRSNGQSLLKWIRMRQQARPSCSRNA